MPYSESEVKAKLADDLPNWSLNGGMIERTYETGSWALSQTLFGLIGHIAEAACHHPDILVTFPKVTVRLVSHDADGITDKDFEVAAMIEQLATLTPGDDSALDGYAKAYGKEWIK